MKARPGIIAALTFGLLGGTSGCQPKPSDNEPDDHPSVRQIDSMRNVRFENTLGRLADNPELDPTDLTTDEYRLIVAGYVPEAIGLDSTERAQLDSLFTARLQQPVYGQGENPNRWAVRKRGTLFRCERDGEHSGTATKFQSWDGTINFLSGAEQDCPPPETPGSGGKQTATRIR